MKNFLVLLLLLAALAPEAKSQSSQYSRKKPAAAPAPTNGSVTPAPTTAPQGDKLDLSDLEQKYWAPKDTDFSVVQNRTYTKAKRFSANILVGPIVNETFSSGFNYNFGASYYFSERMGVEASYILHDLGDSSATTTFKTGLSGGSAAPDFNRPTQTFGVSFNYVPLYAKMSFLNKKIIYFDMQISPGLAIASYDQYYDSNPATSVLQESTKSKSALAFTLDVTQFFFLSPHWTVRADIRNSWYNQDFLKYSNGSQFKSDIVNITQFLVGVSYFF